MCQFFLSPDNATFLDLFNAKGVLLENLRSLYELGSYEVGALESVLSMVLSPTVPPRTKTSGTYPPVEVVWGGATGIQRIRIK
jgi:hypothetical protein